MNFHIWLLDGKHIFRFCSGNMCKPWTEYRLKRQFVQVRESSDTSELGSQKNRQGMEKRRKIIGKPRKNNGNTPKKRMDNHQIIISRMFWMMLPHDGSYNFQVSNCFIYLQVTLQSSGTPTGPGIDIRVGQVFLVDLILWDICQHMDMPCSFQKNSYSIINLYIYIHI